MPPDETCPFEHKASDWGRLPDGRLVALDYSAPALSTPSEIELVRRLVRYFASIRSHRGSDPRISFIHNESGQIIETSLEARAGFLDRPTLAALIVSTGLIIGLFALI